MCKVLDFLCVIAIIGSTFLLAYIIYTREDFPELATIWNDLTAQLF